MKRCLFLAVCTIAVLLLPGRARALGFCTVGPVTALDFGTYNVFATGPTQVPGQLVVHCVSLLATQQITVSLSKGTSGSYGSRTMKLGATALQYNIYLGGYTTVFGDGTSGTLTYGPVSPSGLIGGDLTVNFFGQIPARQNVAAGIYLDTLVVTVSF